MYFAHQFLKMTTIYPSSGASSFFASDHWLQLQQGWQCESHEVHTLGMKLLVKLRILHFNRGTSLVLREINHSVLNSRQKEYITRTGLLKVGAKNTLRNKKEVRPFLLPFASPSPFLSQKLFEVFDPFDPAHGITYHGQHPTSCTESNQLHGFVVFELTLKVGRSEIHRKMEMENHFRCVFFWKNSFVSELESRSCRILMSCEATWLGIGCLLKPV